MASPMRLAFRVEGRKWVCYCAKMHTMDGALWMGEIAIGIAEDPACKEQFIAVMRSALTRIMKDRLNIKIESWNDPVSAPESERSGTA